MTGSNTPPPAAVPVQRRGHRTYHLVPASYWQNQKEGDRYLPERFHDDGFIHCTDTLEEVVAVGNRYYRSDPRPYLLLEIDCDSVSAPIVYEDAARIFPHIYGPLEVAAVRRALPVEREEDGRFVSVQNNASG